MSLRKRIMLLVALGLILVTVPLGVMGVAMLRAATDRILKERLAMAEATAQHLDDRILQGWDRLHHLSLLVGPLWAAGDLEQIDRLLDAFAPHLSLFSGGIFLVNREGYVVAQEVVRPILRPPSLSDAVWIQPTLTQGRPAISGALHTAGGIPAVVFTTPVQDPGGKVAGALGGIIDLTSPTLEAFITGLAVGRSGHAVIVSDDGVILASTTPGELFTRDEHPELFARLIAEGGALVTATEEVRHPDGRVETHIMAFARLGAAPWGLAFGHDEEETFGLIWRLRDRALAFALAALLAALLFAWLDTGAVTTPLRRLKEAAETIASGDLGREIEVRRADEIGVLAGSFEAMRRQLLHSLEEIRRRAEASHSLYAVGTEVLSLQDRQAILQSVADRAAALLSADVAVLCLLDESGTQTRVSAVAGIREAVRSDAGAFPARRDSQAACLECGIVHAGYRRAHLAMPLVISERTVGALCVAAATPRTFAPEEREVLAGLANLAAIAVENARLQEQVQSFAVLEERERIARELHDSVGQLLGYVNTKAQAAGALLDDGKAAQARKHLVQLEVAAREVYADLREAILGLRTEVSPGRRLMPALEEYVRRFSMLSGVPTELVVEGDPTRYRFAPAAELHLVRIIQEALTNVRKHAMARQAWVRFAEDGASVIVTVADDGQRFDPAPPPGVGWPKFGLRTMRERAEAIGGRFDIRARDGAGTEVVVRLPVRREG